MWNEYSFIIILLSIIPSPSRRTCTVRMATRLDGYRTIAASTPVTMIAVRTMAAARHHNFQFLNARYGKTITMRL